MCLACLNLQPLRKGLKQIACKIYTIVYASVCLQNYVLLVCDSVWHFFIWICFHSFFVQVSYEDFKMHMSQMYQQYEMQRVDNISDPAIRQQHPISTISGLDRQTNGVQSSTVKINEVVDTSENGTQCEDEAEKAGKLNRISELYAKEMVMMKCLLCSKCS